MRFIRGFVIIGLVLACMPLHARIFQMKGWEYETRLSNEGAPLVADDIYFVKAAVLNKKIYLFYRSLNSMKVALFENGRVIATKSLLKLDPYTEPVIKEDSNSLVILAYSQGAYQFYRMTDINSVHSFYSFNYPMNYNFDFFILGSKILISLPAMSEGRYIVRILLLDRKGNRYESKQMDLSALDEKDKGLFYFRIYKRQDKYYSYFIRRYYDVNSKVIGDSIFTFQITDLAQIKNVKPFLLLPFGFSDHPPEILADKDSTYILYTRKRGTVYSFRLITDRNRIEYTVSKDYINAFYPRYFFNDGVLDFFYLGNLENNTQIYYRKIDMNRLNELGYLETESSNIAATTLSARVSSFSTCSRDNEKYLFFVCENDHNIYFTRNDTSVPQLDIAARVKDDKGKSYYYFTWGLPDDPSGIAGYAYQLDKKPDTVPMVVNLAPSDRLVSTKYLDNGRFFLHIRAVDGLGNAGPVQHLRFDAAMKEKLQLPDSQGQGNLVRNPWIDSIDQALDAVNGELSVTNNYQLAEYAALLVYYRDISKNIQDNNYPLAKKYLNRSILIGGHQMETALYHQLIRKNEENIIYKNQMLFYSLVFFLFMMVLIAVYFGVSKI